MRNCPDIPKLNSLFGLCLVFLFVVVVSLVVVFVVVVFVVVVKDKGGRVVSDFNERGEV